MREFLRRWWPMLKVLMVVAVVLGVGWHLFGILRNEELSRGDERSPAEVLWDETRTANLGGLVACGGLYLAGLGFSAVFWVMLMRTGSNRLPWVPGVRAYYLSHLGKYVPVKGWALVMRTTMAAAAGGRPGAAVLTSFYEVLTTMAAGALVAAIFLLVQGGDEGMRWKAIALVILAGVPILPGVFNRVVARLTRRFQAPGGPPLPQPGPRSLVFGLAVTGLSWLLLGVSLQALLLAMGIQKAGTFTAFVELTSVVAVSYVAAFLTPSPGGLGVREFLLQQMLAPHLERWNVNEPSSRAVVAVLLLRLLWTVAELVAAALVVWLPHRTTGRAGSVMTPVSADGTNRGHD